MQIIKNFGYRFIASFYMELRDFQENHMNNPIKSLHYHLRMQKWQNKIKLKGEE